MRFWISRVGSQYLEGQFVRLEGNTVILKDHAGEFLEVALDDLSNEDREWAQRASHAATRSPVTSATSEELPPPRPQPDNGLDQPLSAVAPRTAPAAEESAAMKKVKELPKVFRTLKRLLVAGTQPSESSGDRKNRGSADQPLFGPDSSVYVQLSGKFLNEFIQVPVAQQQEVVDVILGMPVEGNASTRGVATLLLNPNEDHASVEVVVNGQADSVTTGRQIVVNVHSDGRTQFEARKRIDISTDGIDLFEASATAKTTVLKSAVSTEIPGVVGSLVGRVVGRIVEANREEIDYAASERAAYRAAKELDQRIDSEVVRVQDVLSEIAPGLAAGEPIVPIRFRTSAKTLGILVGQLEPEEWKKLDRQVARDLAAAQVDADELADVEHDITIVLPKKTVSTAKRLEMAMRLLSISIEDQLEGIIKPEELKPHRQTWSDDGEWLTLAWNVDATIVELLSKDFLAGTSPAVSPPPRVAPPTIPRRGYPNVPSWNRSGQPALDRRPTVFRRVRP